MIEAPKIRECYLDATYFIPTVILNVLVGARGYVHKRASPVELIQPVQDMYDGHEGKSILSASVKQILMTQKFSRSKNCH